MLKDKDFWIDIGLLAIAFPVGGFVIVFWVHFIGHLLSL